MKNEIEHTPAPTTAIEVARYFLALQDEDVVGDVSNLKLQKLLYYAQGVYLALEGRALFSERIEAWMYGPVVPDVYHLFKQYEGRAVPPEEAVTTTPIKDDAIRDLLTEVYEVFGQFSPWRLRDMTHEEDPYKETPAGGIISEYAMQQYFSQRVTASNGET